MEVRSSSVVLLFWIFQREIWRRQIRGHVDAVRVAGIVESAASRFCCFSISWSHWRSGPVLWGAGIRRGRSHVERRAGIHTCRRGVWVLAVRGLRHAGIRVRLGHCWTGVSVHPSSKSERSVLRGRSPRCIGGQFEQVLSELDGSSAGERQLEAGLTLPSTSSLRLDQALDEVSREHRLLDAAVLHQVIREHEGAELLLHHTADEHQPVLGEVDGALLSPLEQLILGGDVAEGKLHTLTLSQDGSLCVLRCCHE